MTAVQNLFMPTQHKINLLARRLMQMSRKELIFRGRQFAWNRCEAIRCGLRLESSPDAAPNQRPNSFVPAPRFFFSTAELPLLTKVIQTRLPQVAQETIEWADRICGHRFNLLGYRDLDLGKRINWHLDPVHLKEAPAVAFFKVPYLDFETVGDSKITWELNRHQQFITLGKAYQLTHNERYAEEFAEEFNSWLEQNPYLTGINWASSLEVALRSLSWLWARELFEGSQALSTRLKQNLAGGLKRNAKFIERNLSTYFSPNTHLLGEALALFFIGVLCPGLEGATHWRKLGWHILLSESERQVRSDGGYFEQATYYHTYALDMLLHGRILAWRNEIRVPAKFDQIISNMMDYLAALSVGGPVPQLGDDDGGRLFDPSRNRSDQLSDPLSTGAALFRRSDWKAASNGLVEETIWLLGPAGAADFDALPEEKPQADSKALRASGIYTMVGDGLRMVIDAGPFGAGNCGHAHSDALSITLATDGREWLTDSGTFTYTGSVQWREFFRGTSGHNTLRVDGIDQADPFSPFLWKNTPIARTEDWWTGQHFDLLVASHDGYRRLKSPVAHKRLVFFVKPRFWVVIDSVEGRGSHQLELFWHFPPEPARLLSSSLQLTTAHGDRFGVLPVRDSDWQVELVDGWHSESYGSKKSAPALRCSTQAGLPTEFATLLIPRLEEFTGQFERIADSSNLRQARGYWYSHGQQRHSWALASGPHPWRLNDVESDARFCYWEEDSEGKPLRVFLRMGSFLSVHGIRLVDLKSPQEHVEKTWERAEFTPREPNQQDQRALVLGNERAQ